MGGLRFNPSFSPSLFLPYFVIIPETYSAAVKFEWLTIKQLLNMNTDRIMIINLIHCEGVIDEEIFYFIIVLSHY
jgi:hypothetical protein